MNFKKPKMSKRLLGMLLAVTMILGVMVPMNVKAAAPVPGSIAVGIDVSKYNGAINWQAVAADGVTFAFIRIATTLKGVDPYFHQNIQGAQAAGIRTGVYLYSYATNPAEAAVEANLVLQTIGNYPISFPVVIDIESNPQKNCTPQQLSEVANTFSAIVENAGFYPMVYASKNWFRDRIGPVAADKWVAQYGPACEDPTRTIWQASSSGTVSGINGSVDINYLYKDYSPLIIAEGLLQRKGAVYLYKNYRMQVGWQDLNGQRYYLDPAGKMQFGWLEVDQTGKHYMHPTGEMARGLTPIGNATYYFDINGVMKTGVVQTEQGVCLFDPNGVMQTGFVNDGQAVYYYNPVMTVGLATIDGAKYYFNEKGQMQTGTVVINGTPFMFAADGKMQTGWVNDGVNKYYMQPDTGVMIVNNLAAIEGKTYYFNEAGQVQTGIFNAAGNTYGADAAGALITNQMIQIGETWYYFGADGMMAKNAQIEVAGIIYGFNEKGHMIAAVPVGTPAPVTP